MSAPEPVVVAAPRRRPRRIVIAALVVAALLPPAVVVTVAIGVVSGWGRGSAPADVSGPTGTTESAPTYPEAWDRRVAPIAEWVAERRGLDFRHPVEVLLLPEDEYRARAIEDPPEEEEDEEETAQEIRDTVSLLRALGLVHGQVDLEGASDDLMGAGTLAFYDTGEEKVYVRGTELTPGVRATLAHELTHVLQDQHFDLDRADDPEFDRYAGLDAMVEGDANRVEALYVEELTEAEREAYEEELEASYDDSVTQLGDVPPVLSVLFEAPYLLGEGFLAHLEETEGEGAIDAALRDPPSDEELLDPTVRGTARAEEVDVEVEAPAGVEVIEEDSFGSLTWYLILASRGDPVAALTAVRGWGGDAFASYEGDGEVCVVATVVGDDAPATGRLHLALAGWAAADPAGGADVTRRGDGVQVRSCDPGEGSAPVGEIDPWVFWYPGVWTTLTAEVHERAPGIAPEEVTCAVGRMFETVSVGSLVYPDEWTVQVQARVVAAITACR